MPLTDISTVTTGGTEMGMPCYPATDTHATHYKTVHRLQNDYLHYWLSSSTCDQLLHAAALTRAAHEKRRQHESEGVDHAGHLYLSVFRIDLHGLTARGSHCQ